MRELFKHDHCYFIIKINLRNINFKEKDLAAADV